MKLLFQSILKFTLGVLMIALLFFLPAGTFDYWNAWLLMGLLFIPMFIAGIILWIKNPDLLRKRLNVREKESEQKQVIGMSLIIFIFGFILAGLDFRYGWSNMPSWVVIGASVIFVISYILYAEVLRENTYLSRTVEVQENQKVIDTGLYGIVRHPMYFATTQNKIVAKLCASIIIVILVSLILRYVNGYTTFKDAFINGFLIWTIVNWYDVIVFVQ